ncbi:hypothetical membrane protein [Corynebacterium renale]|uniref:general stress protein n=1 Tax=Corynebacterium renale TaxID=1724 RepID=UPI000DA369CB|nr:general stress protein [Corynebacterium renale]SQG64441.1 hypothetical membrane protein [Corynebacterium renale]STC95281.1 hypothetical membrane protein [Corynebacterium renale]
MANNRTPAPHTRQRPSGWPVGSFESYLDAQAAVDKLSDQEFPVDALTIVGVDLLEVENVTGRLTWGKVIGSGALSGAWIGIFIGLLLGIFGGGFFGPILTGVIMGAIFGIIMAAVPYAMSGGARDFTSATTIVAGRYDLLCDPALATKARDAIAAMQYGTPAQSGYPAQPAPRESAEENTTPDSQA